MLGLGDSLFISHQSFHFVPSGEPMSGMVLTFSCYNFTWLVRLVVIVIVRSACVCIPVCKVGVVKALIKWTPCILLNNNNKGGEGDLVLLWTTGQFNIINQKEKHDLADADALELLQQLLPTTISLAALPCVHVYYYRFNSGSLAAMMLVMGWRALRMFIFIISALALDCLTDCARDFSHKSSRLVCNMSLSSLQPPPEHFLCRTLTAKLNKRKHLPFNADRIWRSVNPCSHLRIISASQFLPVNGAAAWHPGPVAHTHTMWNNDVSPVGFSQAWHLAQQHLHFHACINGL